jgi:hypothetical protein
VTVRHRRELDELRVPLVVRGEDLDVLDVTRLSEVVCGNSMARLVVGGCFAVFGLARLSYQEASVGSPASGVEGRAVRCWMTDAVFKCRMIL